MERKSQTSPRDALVWVVVSRLGFPYHFAMDSYEAKNWARQEGRKIPAHELPLRIYLAKVGEYEAEPETTIHPR